MGNSVLVRNRRLLRLLGPALGAVLLLGACTEAASPTVRPVDTPLGTSRAPTNPPTPLVTPRPTPPPWPAGWPDDFCPAFVEVAIASELIVDIPRALEEEATEDATALSRELRATAIGSRELIEGVPEWDRAVPALAELDRLADFGARIGRQFLRFLDQGRRPGLNRARELIEEVRPVAEEANSILDDLARLGISCPPHGLSVEVPPEP